MTLTLRIEDGSPEYKALQQVKELSQNNSATKAIFKALIYAKDIEKHLQEKDKLTEKSNNAEKQLEQVIRKMRDYFATEEYIKDLILKL